MILIIFVIWVLIGMYSFIYWWTKYYDFELEFINILVWICSGILGPIMWLIGKYIFKKHKNKNKILFKKNAD